MTKEQKYIISYNYLKSIFKKMFSENILTETEYEKFINKIPEFIK